SNRGNCDSFLFFHLSCFLIPLKAATAPRISSKRLALNYFDMNYKTQFGSLWPSIRISLLSEQKYGVLLNNYSDVESVTRDMEVLNAKGFNFESQKSELSSGAEAPAPSPTSTAISPNIQCYTFPKGDISRFPPNMHAFQHVCALLRVLSVTLLCGVVAILASALVSLAAGQVAANDISASGTKRLGGVLHSYVPKELHKAVRVTSLDGRNWGKVEKETYDKVLVDVPCTPDRQCAMEEEDNIFKRIRSQERQMLPMLQMQLLISGILAAKPGGEVVYSTCTLSQLQNEYIVERATELIENQYSIGVRVENCNHFRKLFHDTFSFSADCRLGELVLPHLTANFGPVYFCKLQRVR
uniref:5-cytosine rRNA methyltransferase NSUN4 n=1 Tax=Sphenodon punctatus TaxID=8508 RepID=A0A8D0L623_SPHPU